eukprot:gene31492-6678_t
MQMPQPPDLPSFSSIRPFQYPLGSGELTCEHSVSSSARTEAQTQVPVGHYIRSQESEALHLQAGERGTTSADKPAGHYIRRQESRALQPQTGEQGTTAADRPAGHYIHSQESGVLQRIFFRCSLPGSEDSGTVSGMSTPERGSPMMYPSSPKCLLSVSESAGIEIEDMVDEDLRKIPFQAIVDQGCRMRTQSVSSSGTEQHYSCSSTASDTGPEMLCYDAILLLQTDITERADLEARIAALAEAQTDIVSNIEPPSPFSNSSNCDACACKLESSTSYSAAATVWALS